MVSLGDVGGGGCVGQVMGMEKYTREHQVLYGGDESLYCVPETELHNTLSN